MVKHFHSSIFNCILSDEEKKWKPVLLIIIAGFFVLVFIFHSWRRWNSITKMHGICEMVLFIFLYVLIWCFSLEDCIIQPFSFIFVPVLFNCSLSLSLSELKEDFSHFVSKFFRLYWVLREWVIYNDATRKILSPVKLWLFCTC